MKGKKKTLFGLVIFFILGMAAAEFMGLFPTSMRVFSTGAQVVTWPDLMGMNPQTGELSPKLIELKGKRVKIPGFVVPLTDNISQFKDFLLVPDPMACIHAPPPPPNQMIYVKLDKAMNIERSFGPVWVEAPLEIEVTESQYGKVGFQLKGADVEPYKFKKDN